MGVGIFWIGLNRADLGCWRLTLIEQFAVSGSSVSNRDMFEIPWQVLILKAVLH